MDVDFDDDGWTVMHHCIAAEKELLMSIEKYVSLNEEFLEVETKYDFQYTPLLMAAEKNKLKSVQTLISLGARVNAVDSRSYGIVEVCTMVENLETIHYFIEVEHSGLNVWKRLIKFLTNSSDKEAEKAASMAERLTRENSNECKCDESHWKPFVDNDGIPAIVKVWKSSGGDHVKVLNISIINNFIHHPNIPNKLAKAGGIKVLVGLLGRGIKGCYTAGFNIIREVAAVSEELANQINDSGFLQIATKVLTKPDKLSAEALTSTILTIRNIACQSKALQVAVSKTPGIFEALCALFHHSEFQTSIDVLDALCKAIASVVTDNNEIQNMCIDAGVACPLLMVSRANKYRDLQTNAITALYHLSRNNKYTRDKLLIEGAVPPLLQILKRTRIPPLQEAISLTLWSLAGSDINEKRSLATMMGVSMLIEFLGAAGNCADNLNYIGAKSLGVLAQGAHNQQTAIRETNGIPPLIRQLRSSNTNVVISVIQTLRHLSVGIGFVTNSQNQQTIAKSRGLKFLVALMAHSKNEMVQVESAISLGAITLGHQENTTSLHDNPDFSFLHPIRLLYSSNDQVRSLAGTALAMFSFNSVIQQKKIADCGGVRWENFSSFLESDDDMAAVSAAFQVVVLSRIIPDKEPALSSAEGIKTLVGRLETTENDDVKSLASDCIARLAHTRAGVPSAMISINAVRFLCKFLNYSNDQIRGCAAIALGYLSFDHTAEREMLRLCRDNPNYIHALNYYTKNYKLSPAFIEGWKHCLHVGLPNPPSQAQVDNYKLNLADRIREIFMIKPKELTSAFLSLSEEPSAARTQSHAQSSRASQILAGLHDDMSQRHGQSSNSSRLTLQSGHRNIGSKQSSIPSGPSISQQSQISSLAVANVK